MNSKWVVTTSMVVLLFNCLLASGFNLIGAQEVTSENVWISSVEWINEKELVATHSQGLLLRPGKLVRLSSVEPQKLELLSESETSLWSAVDLQGPVIASDYKGRLIRFEGGKSNLVDLNARWIRCLTKGSNTSKELVAGTEDGQLIVVSLESMSEVRRAKIEPVAAVFHTAFNAQQSQLAVAMGDGSVHLLSWPGLETQKILKGTNAIWSCVYSQDGSQLITGGADRKINLWDVSSGSQIVSIASTRDWVTSMQLLPNTNCVLAGCLNGEVVLADYNSKLPVKTVKVASSGIWDLAVSPDGLRLALGTRKHGVQIVDCGGWYEEAKETARLRAAEKPPEPQ